MRVHLGILALLTSLAWACGDDTVETVETADAGEDTRSTRGVVYNMGEQDAGIDDKSDESEDEERVMHTRVQGNKLAPVTCDQLCRSEALVCDDDYHTFIGTGGGRGVWGPIEDMLRCDKVPEPLRTSFTGTVFELDEFECYCLPGTQ